RLDSEIARSISQKAPSIALGPEPNLPKLRLRSPLMPATALLFLAFRSGRTIWACSRATDPGSLDTRVPHMRLPNDVRTQDALALPHTCTSGALCGHPQADR